MGAVIDQSLQLIFTTTVLIWFVALWRVNTPCTEIHLALAGFDISDFYENYLYVGKNARKCTFDVKNHYPHSAFHLQLQPARSQLSLPENLPSIGCHRADVASCINSSHLLRVTGRLSRQRASTSRIVGSLHPAFCGGIYCTNICTFFLSRPTERLFIRNTVP